MTKLSLSLSLLHDEKESRRLKMIYTYIQSKLTSGVSSTNNRLNRFPWQCSTYSPVRGRTTTTINLPCQRFRSQCKRSLAFGKPWCDCYTNTRARNRTRSDLIVRHDHNEFIVRSFKCYKLTILLSACSALNISMNLYMMMFFFSY